MKKVAILAAVNVRHMSLISLYTDILKKHGIEYDLIYMDKYNEDEDFDCAHKYRFVNVVNQKWPRIIKSAKYMLFRPYAQHILNKNKYDLVIVWNDLAIFMFADYLPRRYKGKYCLNVRDNMLYNDPRYAKRYEKCFLNSAFNTISSKGYLDFLPKAAQYQQIHSINLSALEGMKIHTAIRAESEPIRIGFIGYVRYFERNKKLLDVFANDPRFTLCYYGTKADVLREYAEKNGIRNVDFHDTFPVAETGKFMEKIDIINNLYGNDSLNVRKAISIKYFHAMYARIPILVCPDTYVGELAKQRGIGFEVDEIDEAMKERLYVWYRNLDFADIERSCKAGIEEAVEENRALETVLMACLQEKEE